MNKAILILFLIPAQILFCQSNMVGDGFGGRLWYRPYNYSVGSYSGYAVCGDSSQLYSWGMNHFSQLGNGNFITSKTPIKIPGMTNIRFVTGAYCCAAIKCDSTGYIWGFSSPNNFPPKKVISGVKHADASIGHLSFVKYDGTVWSMGYNIYGQFGDGSSNNYNLILVPKKMNNMTNAVRVACSQNTNAVLLADGTVKTSGANYYGLLGNNTKASLHVSTPVVVTGLKGIIDIKATTETFMALDSAGDVFVWGYAFGRPSYDSVPRKIPQFKNIVAISGCADGHTFLAIDSGKKCYAFGAEGYYAGCGNVMYMPIPILVDSDVVDVLPGELFSYIIKSDGSLWASGDVSVNIWMNLPNQDRNRYTRLEPTDTSMNLCAPIPFHFGIHKSDTFNICPRDSFKLNNIYYKPDTSIMETTVHGSCSLDTLFKTTVIRSKPGSGMVQHAIICNGDTFKVGNNSHTLAGTYNDSLITWNGCDSIITTILQVKSIPKLSIHDTTLCDDLEEAIQLSAGNYQSYLWFPGGETTGDITVTKPGLYIVSVTTFDSCTFSDSVVVKTKCEGSILIPNTFTINRDNLNDAFDIEITGETEYHLKIFNRWGEVVYESNTDGTDNDGINWNGKLFNKGEACNPGVYYYRLSYKFSDAESRELKGDITLIRE